VIGRATVRIAPDIDAVTLATVLLREGRDRGSGRSVGIGSDQTGGGFPLRR
jgi:hypothetical protein